MKKYRIAVIALLALLFASAAGCLLSFAYGALQDRSQRVARARLAAFKLQEEEFRELGTEHDEWKRLPQELQRFRREQIISMDDFARFRRELNLCLDDNGLRAAGIGFQFGPSKDRVRRVVIGFNLEGAYRDLKKFIYDMERKPKMQFFQGIDLTGGPGPVKGKFIMEAYLGD